jgi:hypothetical protein
LAYTCNPGEILVVDSTFDENGTSSCDSGVEILNVGGTSYSSIMNYNNGVVGLYQEGTGAMVDVEANWKRE